MRDGTTRPIDTGKGNAVFSEFLARFRPTLVILSGGIEGTEYRIDAPRVTIGRGPGVDLAFDDSAMSREHAAIEFGSEGLRLRDMGSTNGTLLNGSPCSSADLKHGDKLQVGGHLFQILFEEGDRSPQAFEISDE